MKTLTVIVILFVLCMLPLRVTAIVMFGDEDQVLLARKIRRYAAILTVMHSCVNPIAYGTLTKHFRLPLVRFARWVNSLIKCRIKCESCKKNHETTGLFLYTKIVRANL